MAKRFSKNQMGAAFVFFVVTAAPQFVASVDARGTATKLVEIEIDHNSPAYAALEDLRESAVRDIPAKPVEVLRSGTPMQFPDEAIKLAEGHRLAGMTISQGSSLTDKPMVLARNDHPARAERADLDASLYGTDGELLSLSERKQKLFFHYLSDPPLASVPTVSSRARELISQELAKAPLNPTEKIIPTASGGRILVTATPVPSKSQKEQSPVETKPATPIQLASVEKTSVNPLVLKGKIELSGGLAFIGSEAAFEIQRVYENRVLETGRVWPTEGRFEIAVKEPKGYLQANLKNINGERQGSAELDLLELPKVSPVESQIADLKLKLKPISVGAVVRLTSAYSSDTSRIELENPKVTIVSTGHELKMDEDGLFTDKDLKLSSSYVVRGQAKRHWDSLAIGISGKDLNLQMLPNSMGKALLELSRGSELVREAEQMAIIWGRIEDSKGRPIANARVELAGDLGLEPIYFNRLMIPDKKLDSTSKNGLFAFVQVPPGIQSLRAKVGPNWLPAQIVVTESATVSNVIVEVQELKTREVKVFDAFNPEMALDGVLHVLGSENDLEVPGHASIQFVSGQNLLTAELDAGQDFEKLRLETLRDSKHLDFPMIRKDWLHGLATSKRITLDPNRGTVVGFLNSPATAYSDSEADLVYFDKTGRVLGNSEQAQAAGFVLFNVPPGVRSVAVVGDEAKYTLRTLVAEPNIINLLAP